MTTAEDLLRKRIRKFPGAHAVHLQIADRCNHTCDHCYQIQGQKGELTRSEILEAINRLHREGLLFLTISGGEATLRSDLLDIVAHARQLDIAVTLFTNGYTMTSSLADRLAELAVWQVQVSLYAGDPAIHDGITRVPGSHVKTLAGITLLRERNVHVIISMPVMAVNARQVTAVRALAERLGCPLKLNDEMIPREDGSEDTSKLTVSREDRDAELSAGNKFWSFSTEDIAQSRAGSTCGVGHGSLTVEPNGEVRPCPNLHIPLGNVLHDTIASINATDAPTFLRSVKTATLHGCRDCDLISACMRCHGNAALEGGDAFGPYKSACQRALARYRAVHEQGITMLPAPNEDGTRDRELGPFRIEGIGLLRPIPDVRTEEDDAIARKFAWVRPHRDYATNVMKAPMGKLVQLRLRRATPDVRRHDD